MKKFNFVYQITNLINNKIYVGVHSTNNLNDGYMGSGDRIIVAIEKYGIENFKREILFECFSIEEAYAKEAEIVNEEFIKREDVYNIKKGGQIASWEVLSIEQQLSRNERMRKTVKSRPRKETMSPEKYNQWIERNRLKSTGVSPSKESQEKRSASLKKTWEKRRLDLDWYNTRIEKIRNKLIGSTRKPESNKKQSETRLQRKIEPWNKGKKVKIQSSETKLKRSNTMKLTVKRKMLLKILTNYMNEKKKGELNSPDKTIKIPERIQE